MDDRDIVPMLRKYSNSFDLIAADYIERLEADVWKIKPGDPSTGFPDGIKWKEVCDMADGVLASIKDKLTECGIDMSATPPMFYPEAIHNLRAGLLRQIRDLEAVVRAGDALRLGAINCTGGEHLWTGEQVHNYKAARSRVNIPPLTEQNKEASDGRA